MYQRSLFVIGYLIVKS